MFSYQCFSILGRSKQLFVKCKTPLLTICGNNVKSSFSSCSKTHRKIFRYNKIEFVHQRPFQTTSRRPVPPLIAIILKTAGIKFGKGLTVLLSRFMRKQYLRSPKKFLSRFKIAAAAMCFSFSAIIYYTYRHYEATPITGRQRWITFTKEQSVIIADETHADLVETHKELFLTEDHPKHKRCQRVLDMILKSNSDITQVNTTNWHINVVEQDDLNAFVLPNGEIYFFTGMLDFLQNSDELGVVLGHEMSHALLGHAQEQQTYMMIGNLLVIPLLSFAWFMLDDIAASFVHLLQSYIFKILYSYGFDLPKSREMEAEADMLGMRLVSKACMDPRVGVFLWDRMTCKEELDRLQLSKKSELSAIPSADMEKYFSTHPPSQARALEIEESLPSLIALRNSCKCNPLSPNDNPLDKSRSMRRCSSVLRNMTKLEKEIADLEKETDDKDYQKLKKEKLKDLERLEIYYKNSLNELNRYFY